MLLDGLTSGAACAADRAKALQIEVVTDGPGKMYFHGRRSGLFEVETREPRRVTLIVRLGFELKRTSAPRATRSMVSALEELKLDRLFVIYPGDRRFPLHERVEAVGIRPAMEGCPTRSC